MENLTYVYWIHHKNHIDMFSEGYIGVSNNVQKRFLQHCKLLKNNKHENRHFQNAYNQIDNLDIVVSTIIIGNNNYCYEIEEKLRPQLNVGWNIAIGGAKPPISKYRGDDYVSPLLGKKRIFTKEHIENMKKAKRPPPTKNTVNAFIERVTGKKQTPEQIAKRVASRKATIEAKTQDSPFV